VRGHRRRPHEVWLATYIFHDDGGGRAVAEALRGAARGVAVHVVVDGFGSMATLPAAPVADGSGVEARGLPPARPLVAWLQPGQLRRLHQKLCVVDQDVAFVGGINIIDDRNDMNHGWSTQPRLDFAVEVRGPLVGTCRPRRARCGRAPTWATWRDEVRRWPAAGAVEAHGA
jgi:cardiolipin synthase A/B